MQPEKTLDKAALEQYLDGGFSVEAIVYQASTADGPYGNARTTVPVPFTSEMEAGVGVGVIGIVSQQLSLASELDAVPSSAAVQQEEQGVAASGPGGEVKAGAAGSVTGDVRGLLAHRCDIARTRQSFRFAAHVSSPWSYALCGMRSAVGPVVLGLRA